MTVLFLNSSSDRYGSSRILIEVVKVYKSAGLKAVVVLPEPGPLQQDLLELGAIVHIQNLGILRRKYVTISGLVNRLIMNYKAYIFLSQLHREFHFDLVYSNTLAVVIGAHWARTNDIPHTWHIHEILLGPAPLVGLLRRLLDRTTPSPIVVSNAVKNHWEEKLSVSKPTVIHNGIPYSDFLEKPGILPQELGIADDHLIITMVGRINPGKGQLFFLEIAKRITKSYPHCHFVMVGDPYPGYENLEVEMKHFINEHRLENCVTNLGFREDIGSILQTTDIFVLPSILPDSFPTVILEAMAASCPVIATQSGGASEMVLEGETGYLIPIYDLDKAVSALISLILDQQLRVKFGNAGRDRVLKEFSLESFRENIENHLWQLLRKN
ncbi:glycosyltransferase family 4 protein [Algoriphagus yeomjeoni]|uniref:Glycosyltransferase involved in cell wall biosynthesis n=1 Tax=Algoriphagus yeomjeoni TaxID=291403 RepID=A0A327PRV7_9BACT|nr:glycosyltransferase family 4 protein [Algoriphagus yeomjeoni]RAI95105.1 glycosyltransferase involved in cell wall biosynthesis [Algoriphagus yeomjeoni]